MRVRRGGVDKVRNFDKVVLDTAVTKVEKISHKASSRYEGKGASVGVKVGVLIPSDKFNLEDKITLDKAIEGNGVSVIVVVGGLVPDKAVERNSAPVSVVVVVAAFLIL